MSETTTPAVLDIDNLHVEFDADQSIVHAIRGVDFSINDGEIFGVVGESGSGKSVTALTSMGLLDSEGSVSDGQINYRGEDLLQKSERELRQLRGDDIAMVFQDPLNGLNPTLTIGKQIREAFSDFGDAPIRRLIGDRIPGNTASDDAIVDVLEQVGLPNPRDRLDKYPHEFSGGMRQRVMIAIAIAPEPDLLIVDEPTTALDVTTQANIIGLIERLRTELDITVLVISHDMGVIAQLCDRVAVMYAGELMEVGGTEAVLQQPKHPYTDGLLASMPQRSTEGTLHSIEGTVPDLHEEPTGCVFADRCPNAKPDCRQSNPELAGDGDREIACFHPVGDADE